MAINFIKKRPILGSVFFLFSFLFSSLFSSLFSFGLLAAPLKVAVIDTGFCPDQLHLEAEHKISPVIDLTDSVKLDCRQISAKDLQKSPRFHGQKVMETFFSILDKKIPVDVTPLIVFNSRGDQSKEAWVKALTYIKKNKIQIVLSASSLPTNEKLSLVLDGVWFVAAGRSERGISKKTSLFPQLLAPLENLFLIGDYFEGKKGLSDLYDQALLYQQHIDYYFPAGHGSFTGSSHAVALAAGLALNLCAKQIKSAKSFRQCLNSHSRSLQDKVLNKNFLTY